MSMVPWTTRSRPVTARICASTACRKVSRLRSQDIAIRPVRATPSNATIGIPRRFIPWAIVNGISESGWIQIGLDRVLLDRVLLDRAWLDQVGLNQVWSNQVRLNRNRVDVPGSVLEQIYVERRGQGTRRSWTCPGLTQVRQIGLSPANPLPASTGRSGWRPCQPPQLDGF